MFRILLSRYICLHATDDQKSGQTSKNRKQAGDKKMHEKVILKGCPPETYMYFSFQNVLGHLLKILKLIKKRYKY